MIPRLATLSRVTAAALALAFIVTVILSGVPRP